jgi:predicted Zn-dependent peptidase
MSLIVIGGIDEDEALRTLEKSFAPDPRTFVPAEPLPQRSFTHPKQKRAYRQKVGGDPQLSEVSASWYMPLVDAATINLTRSALAERLTERIREKQRASYGVDIEIDSHRDHRVLTVSTSVQPGHEQRTRRVIMEEVLRLADYDDLERHRDESMLSYSFLEPDIDTTFEIVASHIILRGNPRSVAEALTEMARITAEDIRKFAAEHLAPERAYVEIVEE